MSQPAHPAAGIMTPFLLAAALSLCIGLAAGVMATSARVPHYLFYLHGRVIEDQGPNGVSPRFGRYDYPGILAAFRRAGLIVRSEVRPRGSDVGVYANKVVGEVRSLLASGVDPSQITIVGASKGAVIAALVSTRLRQPHVNYVLLANCNRWLIRTHNPHLTGEVLSIYERSDDVGGSCAAVIARSPAVTRYKEVALHTGLGHGMVYRPLAQWMDPTIAWTMP